MDGKILIVDDVATNRIVFKVKLGAAMYQPLLAADGASCLRVAREESPDLILLDLMLPDMSGIDVLYQLRADPMTRDIPVVVFSASSDQSARLLALAAGADDFLTKPIDDQTLLARLRGLLRSREDVVGAQAAGLDVLGLAEPAAAFEHPGLIAVVTDHAERAMRLRRELTGVMTDRIVVLNRAEVLADGAPSRSGNPDIYVIDNDLGGAGGGLRLMSDLRSRTATRHAAICILRADAAPESAVIAFDLGANDLVPAEVGARELALRLRTLLRRKRVADRMRASVHDGLRMAVTDPLTGLHNRRYAIPHLAGIAERAQADGSAFAVMVIDLDRFKSVNDRWGHAAGDAVLVEVARRLAADLRASDLLARIGGEEFLVAIPQTNLADARAVAERLCHAVEERPIQIADEGQLTVTVSIGLAISQGGGILQHDEPVAEIINRADHALLVAKSGGRNQVTISRTAA